MRRLFLFILLIVSVSFMGNAQSLYMPRNVKKAFDKNTRSVDGRPGKNYWQNAGRYEITVTALPPDRTVRGTEKIVYTNNSPDTLRRAIIRLILNIHKPGAARMNAAEKDYLTDGIQIDAFSENGVSRPWRTVRAPYTVQSVSFSKPLMPHDSVQLNFDWHYEISLQSNREGMIDSTTYFLAYWYPRVSVYDDYNGWDEINFTDQQEFYNDFNDYSFTVIAPKNFIVWATGDLQNPTEVLQPQYEKRLRQSMTIDSVMHIATVKDLADKQITAQQPQLSWKWKANAITDVTIGLSDHYVWDASSVQVDDATHRRASMQAAYKDVAKDFHSSVQNGNYALGWFSHHLPGVPYPFSKMTAFQGFADMEYPMMVNDGSTPNLLFSRLVQDHEIAHTFFPFYMGINESRYAFMDEGWATTLELLIGRSEMDSVKADNFYKQFRVNSWINDRSAEEDIPIITPANVLNGAAYGDNAYGKPSLGYLALKDMLGDQLFKTCLHEYMSLWHGKHPIPWDFFNSINQASGRNLNWFWANWYFSNNYIDFALQGSKKAAGGYTLTIQNIGGYVAPFNLLIKYDDGTAETRHETSALWQDNQKSASIDVNTEKKIESVKIEGGIFMDADESNNIWKP
jgi:Peptidase family M1 domain